MRVIVEGRCYTCRTADGTHTMEDAEGNDILFCRSCYYSHHMCPTCESIPVREDDGHMLYGHSVSICAMCAGSRNMVMCSNCNILVDTDEYGLSRVCEGNGHIRSWCEDCAYDLDECEDCYIPFVNSGYSTCRNCNTNTVRQWNANVLEHVSCTLDRTKVYFGVELEVEVMRNYQATTRDLYSAVKDKAILKQDGSLSCGAEIVTIPMSLKDHCEWWPEVKRSFPMDNLECWSKDTCGMHVHISRSPLSQLQIGKMLMFLNGKGTRRFCTKIAGRGSQMYSQYKNKSYRDVRYASNRYEALNLVNRNTIEVRIFKGSLNVDRILRNLEFVAALVRYCGRTMTSVADIQRVQLFTEFVSKNRKEYPRLHTWISDRATLIEGDSE